MRAWITVLYFGSMAQTLAAILVMEADSWLARTCFLIIAFATLLVFFNVTSWGDDLETRNGLHANLIARQLAEIDKQGTEIDVQRIKIARLERLAKAESKMQEAKP